MPTETMRIGDITIEEIDVPTVSDEELVFANAFGNLLRAESNPEDPPRPIELTIANYRNLPSFIAFRTWWARDTDRDIVATASTSFTHTDDNKHLLEAGISVHPEHRRKGLAKTLLSLIVAEAEAQNRTLIMSGTSERVPAGEAFAKRVGAEAGLANHMNRLLLEELDREVVDTWVAEGPGRAPGYSLVTIEGPYPEDLHEQIVAMHNVMNTAPRDDLDMEDFVLTVEHMLEWEKQMLATGEKRWSIFVRKDETGEFVGFTEMAWQPKIPDILWQLATGVRPEHRGFALGKWIKAAMLQRIGADLPDVKEVRTGNADSNDAMLGINKQLGFRHYIASTVWQVRIDKLRAYVGSST